ncbi:MAG: hypothetical protein H7256_14345 [Bdellovibrio sp.]|nr:hypothetical protein [Bdellovibrio sp.]
MQKIICFIFLGLISNQCLAEVCFKNEAEYQAAKEKLPALLQGIPIYLGYGGFKATVASRLNFADGELKFDLQAATIIGATTVSEYVNLCVDDRTVTLNYKNGKSEKVQLTSKGVEVKGVTLAKLANQAAYIESQKSVFNRDPSLDKTHSTPASVRSEQ